MKSVEAVKNYRIKLHDVEVGTAIAIPSYRIVSYWEVDVDKANNNPGHTLINVDGLSDPIVVSEPFDLVDKIVLRAFGWRIPINKKSHPVKEEAEAEEETPNIDI